MSQLNKRQIIILVLMVAVIFYGAYELIIVGPSAKKASDMSLGGNQVSGNIASLLKRTALDNIDAYIIGRAEADWQKNPFMEKNIYREWAAKDEKEETKTAKPEVKIVYSGYVDAGKKKLAIVNGIEYTEGERLEVEGYVLKSIKPAKIKVENKNSGRELEIMLQE